LPFAENKCGVSLFQKLIDVVALIKNYPGYPFEKQNLSKFLKKSSKSNISQLLFLSNITSLRKVKGKQKPVILNF
jgi:hypothetical protein